MSFGSQRIWIAVKQDNVAALLADITVARRIKLVEDKKTGHFLYSDGPSFANISDDHRLGK